MPDPKLDLKGRLARLLQQQLKGYKEQDPEPKQEKAIPLSVLRQMEERVITHLDYSITELCIGAIFFCMQSCKYTKVPNPKDKKTKLLCVRNICFFSKHHKISHSSNLLSTASIVSVTFEDQKNRMKQETITLDRSSDNLLCPVKA